MEKQSIIEMVKGILLPKEISDSFNISNIVEKKNYITIELEEKLDLKPKSDKELVSDGFMNKIELQSFPLKGKAVYLVLHRRRWKEKGGGKDYYNQYNFNPEGVKATKDFASFLKDTLGQTPEQHNQRRRMLMR